MILSLSTRLVWSLLYDMRNEWICKTINCLSFQSTYPNVYIKKKYIYRFTFDTSPLKVPGFFAGYSDLQYIFINSDYHNNMH